MAGRGPLRAARVAMFSLVCVLLAATGHAVAGGHRPSLALLALGGTAVAVTAGRLAGRERTFRQIAGAVTLTQGALHLLFAFGGSVPAPGSSSVSPGWSSGHHSPASHSGHMPHSGHDGAQAVVAGAAETGAEPVGMALAAAHLSPLMVLAHLVAGLGAAWWLRQGEALVWRLGRLLGAPVSAVLHALDLVRRWARHRAELARRRTSPGFRAERGAACRTRVLRHTLARRGPPVLFAH
ncbi:hypothetical protein N4P33_18830 [Streptomyces sp. 15-116A]|uniref:hypothetical protein n=1 Tax=Streptomyces sp. 15-116A TaxID=2259035 RepID=UPI0021B21165|nr:hypothetical protein [Streptomyces sp. 15-116A]MCT7354192.1 hypothetical protein [Streptomyces sp. 15-116A]